MSAPTQAKRDGLFRRLRLRDIGYASRWVGLGTLTGVAAGLAAVGFRWLIETLRQTAFLGPARLQGEGLSAFDDRSWLVVAIPTLGGLLVGILTTWLAPEAAGHGTEKMIDSFHRLDGAVRRRVIAIKALASAITIGSGGSAGQEGPVAQIGGGVGSAVSDLFKLPPRDRRIFLLAGSSAGIGALFTAPLGGALFAPEVLYRNPEFEGEAIIPSIIASIVAFTTFTTITGTHRVVPISPATLQELSFGDPRELLVYVVLALLCTVVGWFYVRTFYGIHRAFKSARFLPRPVRPAIGGLLLGLLALAITPIAKGHGIFFGGYGLMRASIEGGIAIQVLAVLIVAKILATSFSIATGGSGGVFAPSVAIGALLGALVGSAAQHFFPGLGLSPACFAFVGMGGFFAGVAKTPIAAIIIVCEMTGSYGLLAPLMLVSVIHMLLARHWTIFDTQVGSQVDSMAHAGDFVVDVLERMKVRQVVDINRAPTLVSQSATMRKALETVSRASGSYFPVVDERSQLVGIFSLSDIRRIFRESGIEDLVIVRDFMVDHVRTVTLDDSLNDALRVMNELSVHELPVVDPRHPKVVVTMLSRNNLGAAYHNRLRELRRGSN